jgi:signal transduction histidine kinase
VKFTVSSDERILRRVLINMVKNALEASDSGEKVRLNCYIEDNLAVYTVWNEAVISDDVKSQIWQRSFSTKGPSRCIGTYSMKIFTE